MSGSELLRASAILQSSSSPRVAARTCAQLLQALVSGYSAGTETTRKECHMANEPNADWLMAAATSAHLKPAIDNIDAALEGMRRNPSHLGLRAQRDELDRIREQLRGLMDRPLDPM